MYRLISKDFDLLWDALHEYRERVITEGIPEHDEKWDVICTVMQWIQDDLELDY